MNAQSKATATVSNNIANINTTGFKRGDTVFHDLVTTASSRAPYNSGGVRATRVLRVDQQGAIQQTASGMDAAITGNGFFAVKQAPDAGMEFLYTRNGTFNGVPVDSGNAADPFVYLMNSAGFYLYGWELDQDGNLPPNSNDFSSLTPVDISLYDETFLPTTLVEQRINLNSAEDLNDPHLLPGGSDTLPASVQSINGVSDPSFPADFSTTLNVVDTLGNSRQLTFEYRKIVGPMSHFTSSLGGFASADAFIPTSGASVAPAIANGDQFQISVTGGGTETYTFVDEATGNNTAINQVATMQGLIDAINAHGGGNELRARLVNGRLLVQAADPTTDIALSEIAGTPLSAAGSLNIIQAPGGGYTYTPDASLTANSPAYPNQTDFPAFDDPATPNIYNWWEMRILAPADPSITNTLDPMYNQKIEMAKGLLNFNSDGSLNAVPDANNNYRIDLSGSPFDFDASVTGEEAGLIFDIGGLTQFAGLGFGIGGDGYTQFSGPYNVLLSRQNGILPGGRVGAEVTSDGFVAAIFDNGMKRNLYKIPVVTFINPNGLEEISGTAFQQSSVSGDPTLNEAGDNGAGMMQGARLESSNVDLGEEFAKMIVSQRAFGANSQVLRTVDEMTTNLTRLAQ
jgi:flagellar hook protein FlgE